MLLLLTATVDPGGMGQTIRADPAVRLKDYSSALLWWKACTNGSHRIMLYETSGYPLPQWWYSLAGVTVVQRLANDYPKTRGKGFGEARMLQWALAQDQLLAEDWVVKCTGRIRVANAGNLMRQLCQRASLEICVNVSKGGKWADSRFFAGRPAVLARLMSDFDIEVDDSVGRYFEHVLAQRVLRLASEGVVIGPWADLPRYLGVSASTGTRYEDGFGGYLRWLAKRSAYRILSSREGSAGIYRT